MSDHLRETRPAERRTPFGESFVAMLTMTGLLWVMEALDVLSDHRLDGLGVRARDFSDLWSIFTLPLAHADWMHLAANSFPFFVLGLIVLATATWREFTIGLLVIVVVSGLTAWLFSPQFSNTLGASGVIFGWLAYLLTRSFYTRSKAQMVIAFIVFWAFGGILWGVLPSNPTISWQGHLGGAIGGFLAARHLHKRG